MASSGRRPINAPPGSPQAAGVPWLGLSILLVLVLILGAFVAYFFFDVGKDSGGSTGSVAGKVVMSNGTPPMKFVEVVA